MTKEKKSAWVLRLTLAGLEPGEAGYYVDTYPADELPQILEWAQYGTTDLEAEDDGPIHGYDY